MTAAAAGVIGCFSLTAVSYELLRIRIERPLTVSGTEKVGFAVVFAVACGGCRINFHPADGVANEGCAIHRLIR
jgi:hypothetical protein